jgi:hypothetical protein
MQSQTPYTSASKRQLLIVLCSRYSDCLRDIKPTRQDEKKPRYLEEANTALRVLFEQRKKDKRELEENMNGWSMAETKE